MTNKIIYEFECQRNNVTPKQFYNYCKTQLQKRCNWDIENWIECEEWINPLSQDNTDYGTEICKTLPYNTHFFLKASYNFILDFDFDNDKTGYGYCYIKEYER